MIVRVFRALIRKGRAREFKEMVQTQSIPWLRNSEGMVQYIAGAPMGSGDREFIMVTVWRDLESLKSFCGEDWDNPIVTGDEEPLVESMCVDHYQHFDQ